MTSVPGGYSGGKVFRSLVSGSGTIERRVVAYILRDSSVQNGEKRERECTRQDCHRRLRHLVLHIYRRNKLQKKEGPDNRSPSSIIVDALDHLCHDPFCAFIRTIFLARHFESNRPPR